MTAQVGKVRNHRTPGERLRAWREERNVSRKLLAEWLDVDQTAVYRWEKGEALPRLRAAVLLARRSDGAIPVQAWV